MDSTEKIFPDSWKETLRAAFVTYLTGSPQEQNSTASKIGYYYLCVAQASLFKYFSDTTRNLEMIKADKMWYSAPCNFNDAFDCDISIDEKQIIADIMQIDPKPRVGSTEWKRRRDDVKRELRTFRSIFENFKKSTGVTCLSESDDSLLMWSHYANNHRGMCVEYELMEINKQLQFTPVPVVYSNQRACFGTLDMETAGNDATKALIHSLTSKSNDWSYEKEWRIIREKEACGDQWDDDKKGALLDMIRPSSITLGCEATEGFEKAVREYCEESKINLYKMEKDPDLYRLNKKVIFEF